MTTGDYQEIFSPFVFLLVMVHMGFQLLGGMLVLGNCMPLVALVLERLKGGKLDSVAIGYQWMILLFRLLCTLVTEFVETWSGLVAAVIGKIPSLVWTLLCCPDAFVAPVLVAVPLVVVVRSVIDFATSVAVVATVFVLVEPCSFS